MFSPSKRMSDRVGSLPDSIICHILSFLPTQQAVATSILSKHWRPLWKEVSTLNFDDRSYSRNRDTYLHFIQLVYNVLLLRDGEQPIKKFNLVCTSALCQSSMVNAWVMTAKQCKAENIILSLRPSISLSFSVFSSTTLVVLKLSGFCVNGLSFASFPSLKILHLKMLSFQNQRYIPEILDACPVLEDLVIKSLTFSDPLTSRESKHFQLPKLVKVDVSSLSFSLKLFYNVEFLRADLGIKQDIPALNFSNLTYMELHIYWPNLWDSVILLLHYCPHLQNLVIDKRYPEVVEKWVHPQFVPECLISKLKRLCVTSYTGNECELQFTRFIMQNARVLRNVMIHSRNSSNLQKKLQMIQDLSLYPRVSQTSEFHFEW